MINIIIPKINDDIAINTTQDIQITIIIVLNVSRPKLLNKSPIINATKGIPVIGLNLISAQIHTK